MKLKVGDICLSSNKDTYVVRKMDAVKPIEVILVETPHKNNLKYLGHTFTNRHNKWSLYKIGSNFSKLEEIIYGVNLENT